MFKIIMLWLVSFSVMGGQYDWRTAYTNAYTYDPYRNLIVKPRYVKPPIVKKIIDRRYRADVEDRDSVRPDEEEDECEYVDCE